MPIEYDIVPRAEGWNYTFDERMDLWKRRQNEQIRARIEVEALKAPEERFKPPERYNPLSLDLLSTGEYALAAGIQKIAHPEMSIQESIAQKKTGYDYQKEYFEKTGKDPFGLFTPQPYDEPGKEPLLGRELAGRLAFSIQDPFMFLSSIRTGATVFVNGKKAQLTEQGAEFLQAMFKNVPVKEWEKTRYLFSNMLRADPQMYSRFIQKEGMRIWTNFEVIPKQFLPWRWIVPAGKKVGDVGKGGWDVVASAFTRQYGKLLSKIPKTAPLPPPPTFNQMRAANLLDLKNAKKAAEQQVALLLEEAKKQTGRYFNPKVIMTEYAENPNIRNMFPELKPIFDKWEKVRQQMVAIEKSEGILHSERFDYVRHFITWTAKTAKGIKGEAVDAPFDIKRKMEGTISQINTQSLKEKGYKLFNDNFFFATLKRMEEHEQAVASVKLIRSAGQQFGKTAKEVAGDKNYIESSLPQLKGVWLPRSVENALKADKNIGQVLGMMGQRTKYETAKEIITLPLRKGYDFQRWTLHTWEKLQTRGFPAFYALNYYGGKFMSWLGGSADIADDAKAITAMYGRTPANKVIVIDGLTGKEYTKEMINKLADEYKLVRVDPMGVESGKLERHMGITSKAGWMMEEELRLSLFINRLGRGDKPKDAYAYVLKYQFDYTSELQGAEKVMADWIPFFRWQKNAIPFFTQMTFEAYGKMGAFGKLAAASWYSPQAEVLKPYLPDYAKNRINVLMGGDRNDVLSLNLPISTVPDALKKLSSPGNATQFFGPGVQIPYQEWTGKNSFTGKNITDPYMFPIEFFFSRHISTAKKILNPDIPFWEKATELGTGINVIQMNDQMAFSGILDQTSDRLVTNAIYRLNGKYRACGV